MKVPNKEHMYDDLSYEQDIFETYTDLSDFDPFEDEDNFWSVGIKDELDPETVKLLNKF